MRFRYSSVLALSGSSSVRFFHSSLAFLMSALRASISARERNSSSCRTFFMSGMSKEGRAKGESSAASFFFFGSFVTAPEVLRRVPNRTPSTAISSMITLRRKRFRPSSEKAMRDISTAFVIGSSLSVTCRPFRVTPRGKSFTSAPRRSTLAPAIQVPAFSTVRSTHPSTTSNMKAVMPPNTNRNEMSPCQRIHFFMIRPPRLTA